MNSSKVAVVVSAIVEKIQLAAGIFLLVVFGVGTMAVLTEITAPGIGPAVFMCILFDALGVMLIVFSRKRNELLKNFRSYVSYISNDPTGSISRLADSVGTSEEVVYRNLDKMIKNKYFVNAYIDRGAKRLVLPYKEQALKREQEEALAADSASKLASPVPVKSTISPKLERVTVTCKSCGGVNSLPKGHSGECEYCGSPING